MLSTKAVFTVALLSWWLPFPSWGGLTQHTQFVWGETGALFGPLGNLQFGSDRLRPVKQLAYPSSIPPSIPTNTQNIAV